MSGIVPKFGSFKPKSKAKNVETPAPSRPDIDTTGHIRDVARRTCSDNPKPQKLIDSKHDHGSHRDARDHRPRSPRLPHRHRDGDRHERHDGPEQTDFRRRNTGTEELPDSDDYFVDRRGDAKNVEYGTLHRYSIPQYHRAGYGRLLGLPDTKIDREQSTDQGVILFCPVTKHSDHSRSLLSSYRSTTSKENHYHIVVPEMTAESLEIGADYVDLSSTTSRKRKRDDDETEIISSSRLDVDYRSIEGKAKSETQPPDDDLRADADSNGLAEEDLASVARQRNAVLTKATKERPTDAEVWLALIEHQSQLVRSDVSVDRYTYAERRTLADIRLSIYEKALKQVFTGTPGHEDLVLGMLGQGTILWEGSRLTARWAEVLGQHAGSIRLWTKYLDFVQTDHASFRFEKCRAAYIKCFDMLGKARNSASHAGFAAVNKVQVYVLLRYTNFLRDAGYDELAYATWQVLLEYHNFKPVGVDNAEQALKQLEEFWDSDTPRIGEPGAQGWSMSADSKSARAKAKPPRKRSSTTASTILSRLVIGEKDTLDRLHLPATNDDDEDIEDPFRYVMFTDLRGVIEHLAQPLPSDTLISAFLEFLLLPHMATIDGNDGWRADQFVRVAGAHDVMSVQCMRTTTRALFTAAFDSCKKFEPDHIAFAGRAISLLIAARPNDEHLAEYYLAFKLALVPDEAVKSAKKILKSRPSSLRLYNAYALIEAKQGRLDKAVGVWATALKMSASFSDDEKDNRILLWHSWLYMLLLQEGKDAAVLQVILAMCENDTDRAKAISDDGTLVSVSQRIKVKQSLEVEFERMAYKQKPELAILYADCHMWFDYMAEDHALDRALETRKQYSARLKKAAMAAEHAEEVLLQVQTHLIQHHLGRHRPYRSAVLRTEVADGLRAFPDNSSLIRLYQNLSASTRIDDHIRASLHHDLVTGPGASIVGWSHAVEHELRRYHDAETTGSMENSVRSLFTRALASQESKVRHSIVLWRSWLRFEMSCTTTSLEAQRSKALARSKQVFLDGLRALPWCKAWIVEGLAGFVKEGGLTGGEMKMVVEVMRERELRIRMPLDELDEEGLAM